MRDLVTVLKAAKVIVGAAAAAGPHATREIRTKVYAELEEAIAAEQARADADVLLREVGLWIGATAELLAAVPRPADGGGPFSHGRTLLDAIEGGRAWARKIEAHRGA